MKIIFIIGMVLVFLLTLISRIRNRHLPLAKPNNKLVIGFIVVCFMIIGTILFRAYMFQERTHLTKLPVAIIALGLSIDTYRRNRARMR